MDNNPVAKAANEAEHDDELNIQDYLRTLPKSVKSRVCALKKLQLEGYFLGLIGFIMSKGSKI